MSKTHELKMWPEYFRPISEGVKNFEVRKNDRDFEVGDVLVLREYDPESETYTGRIETRDVVYLLRGGVVLGIDHDYVVMGLGYTL